MSDNRLRLFVAMDIPHAAKDLINSAINELRGDVEGARWVKPQNLHLTLKFIGEYTEEGLSRLSNEIRATGERCTAFKAALGGCGAFPSRGRARVIWVGMDTGIEEAGAVARKLDARLEKVGVKREERPFRGHITLARSKRPQECTSVLADLERLLGGLREISFEVDEMVLYRSILGPPGPTYTALERVPLGGKPREQG
jgi:2'-5' RNA ligase